MKKAEIDKELCVGCGACRMNCPQDAIQILPGFKSAVDPDKCTGCGTCVSICHKHAPSLVDVNE